jgi:threonine dehydratase
MSESTPRQYNELLPYHERFRQTHYATQLPRAKYYDTTTVYPDLPDDLILDVDRQPNWGDRDRLHTDAPGDAMCGYAFNSPARLDILAAEKAALRLGVTGLERLDPFVLAVLRAQQAIGDIALRTPLQKYPLLPIHGEVSIKQEAAQTSGSFKIRGAHYKMKQLSPDQLDRGVIAASAGNHAQGVAHSASVLGAHAILVMPANTPKIKVAGVLEYGADVRLIGNSFAAASAACAELRATNPELTYVAPYDDEDVMIGQATTVAEIFQQDREVKVIAVPVGGGGLLAGIVKYAGLVRPDVTVVGVEPDGANGMTRSLRAGRHIESQRLETIAEGAAAQPGRMTFNVIRQYLRPENMINVNDQAIARAAVACNKYGMLTEATGGVALAGLCQFVNQSRPNGTVVAIRSGRNVDPATLDELYRIAA